jgi:hypothetical protein
MTPGQPRPMQWAIVLVDERVGAREDRVQVGAQAFDGDQL